MFLASNVAYAAYGDMGRVQIDLDASGAVRELPWYELWPELDTFFKRCNKVKVIDLVIASPHRVQASDASMLGYCNALEGVEQVSMDFTAPGGWRPTVPFNHLSQVRFELVSSNPLLTCSSSCIE